MFAEIRKPGSAPGNMGGVPAAAAPAPPANGFAAEPPQARELPPPRQAAPQPAPVPVGQQPPAPGVFEAPQAFAPRGAAAGAPAARAASRLPSRRDGSGIPPGPVAPPALAAPPPAFAYQQPAAQSVYQAEQRQAAAPPPEQQRARVLQPGWDMPPAGNPPAASASCGDDLLGQVIAAEDDLITAHRCGRVALLHRAVVQNALAAQLAWKPHQPKCMLTVPTPAGSTSRSAWLLCVRK